MPPSFQHVAEAAAFRSFANGYLREIDPGLGVRHVLRDAPEPASIGSLCFEDGAIRRRLAYDLVVNQIFSVIARMGHDGLIREDVLLGDLARRLEAMVRRMTGAGRAFARSVLEGPSLCTKASLRVRLSARDELASGDGSGTWPAPIEVVRPEV